MEEQKWLEEWHAKRKEEKRAKLEQSEATKENNKNYHAEFMKQVRFPSFLNAEFLNTGYDLSERGISSLSRERYNWWFQFRRFRPCSVIRTLTSSGDGNIPC